MTTYRVDGMSCGGCVKSVTNAIEAVLPEAEVSVDLDAKTVTVNGTDDATKVAAAVDDAGFEFGGTV